MFGCWVGFPPHPQGFPLKVQWKGEQSTPGGCNNFLTLSVRREIDTWKIILGDNPAGHCFVLMGLVIIELFQIKSWLCNWMHAAGMIPLEIPFLPICGISQYVMFLSNRKGKFKLLGLQGDPLSPVPLLSGTSWFPHEKNPAYCNDFLSKQKFNSM